MPWDELSVMEKRMQFVMEVHRGVFSKSSICKTYKISRRTGDKWLARYAADGVKGLEDASRARHEQAHRMSDAVAERLLSLRRKHMKWGAAKLKAWLERNEPGQMWPAASTIGDLLQAHGLTVARKRARHATPSELPLSPMSAPNAVWCADFKGHFRTGDGTRCDPLTITDGHSRFLLRCQAVARPDFAHVQAWFEATFLAYGMPWVLRTDNGPPFATCGLLGLSRLNLWWSKLGIVHERIEPGKPQQNGRHERMHRTLKEATASPPQHTLRAQQRSFNGFVREYNFERPHEALGQRPPADFYAASTRVYTGVLREVTYDGGKEARLVDKSGQISWGGRTVFISETLYGEPVGIEDLDTGQLRLWYAKHELGLVDMKTMQWVRSKKK